MSSAEMTSTIEVLRALAEIEASIDRRMPVTTTSSTWVTSSSGEAGWDWAAAAPAVRAALTPRATPDSSRARVVKRVNIFILPGADAFLSLRSRLPQIYANL